MSKMGAKIDIISRELIKPSSPTPKENKEIKLSVLDQLAPHKYFALLFFYQNHSSCSEALNPSKATLHLKQSLSEILTQFYLLAGKLNPDYLSVDCDDSGALFVEAKVDASLSEALQNAPYESFNQYLPFELCDDDGHGRLLATYPRDEMLVAAQISWFECGSNAIGVCISHKVADFMSYVEFLNSWAAKNRGDCKRFSPDFDSGRNLFPPSELSLRSPFTELKGRISCKRFLFDKEKVTELKDLAISSSSVVKNPTRVEVVTAFLLKQLINVERAKKNSTNQSAAETRLRIMIRHMVNLRSRISSLASSSNPNQEFPFGNFSVAPNSVFNPDEDFRDFGDLVKLTSTTIKKANYDYVMNFVASLSNSGPSNGKAEAEQQQPTVVHFTSWCRFPFHDLDFGWGKPFSVGPAGTPDTIRVILISTPNEDGIEAWIYRLEDELALLPDELLSLEVTNYF
ncbi:OLC1v1031718C1 [Oldenlandia corymbosa var. corymbosa]|uniref:OLC1v1031718C1 n=1 Tax=Oldenlandia corymbosa var. corymbosa TaxID=529605 RepID=A0AAV1CJW2_OLDCO|nr:OLC1v1031718C1 [Oldenlandia corymbosa var. corymbosa]